MIAIRILPHGVRLVRVPVLVVDLCTHFLVFDNQEDISISLTTSFGSYSQVQELEGDCHYKVDFL